MHRRKGCRSLVWRAALTMIVVFAAGAASAAASKKTAPGVRSGADDAATFLQRCKASAAMDDKRARAARGGADTAYCIATIKTAAVAIQNVHEYYQERAKPTSRRRTKPPADPAAVLGGDTCIPPKTTVHAIYVDTQRYAAAHPDARALTPLALMQRAMAAVHPCAKPVVTEKKPVKRRMIRPAKRKR